jgi:hypothetical protein
MRSRNIKPGFFKNEILAECPPITRLLFSGLWCLADRRGRIENRPKKIKAELFPYDNCNIPKMIDQLCERNFIIKYSVNGDSYLQITNFERHQNCHCKEPESTIPAPDEYGAKLVLASDEHGSGPADS